MEEPLFNAFPACWNNIQTRFPLFCVCNFGSAVCCLEAPVSFDIIYYVTVLFLPRIADFNSVHCRQPFPYTDINLHGKWRSHFAKTEPYCVVGVI